MTLLGKNVVSKESWDKVTGMAKYNLDEVMANVLYAKVLGSTFAHAKIKSIDISKALAEPGVKSVLTGNDCDVLFGTIINDRPIIARDKVRYFGEPVAVVVADSEAIAYRGTTLINVEYEQMPVVNSIDDAINGTTLVHENLMDYQVELVNVKPQANTNVSNVVKIRKGDLNKGWAESKVIVEGRIILPQSDHAAMEVRNARVEILKDGTVIINTSSQSSFAVKRYMSHYFNLEEGKIIVNTPLVGGGFGGKSAIQLEPIAYIASKSVGGRPVKIANSREDDITMSPCKLGLVADIKLGADEDGVIKATEMVYLVDGGAYADISPRMAKSIAVDCSGPYNIENIYCDVKSVYTNHTYATSFRGFAHESHGFCIERMMDKLAAELNMDPLELRMKNAIAENHLSPTQVKITWSNTGNLATCLERLKAIMKWDEGTRIELGNGKIRAKGVGCFWKTSDSPTDASSGVILTYNHDGSLNLNCGVIEIGTGTKTVLAQILAEKLKMDANKINVVMNVNTQSSPEHWKTVASMSIFMAGRAILNAADDLINQLKIIAGVALKSPTDDLEVGNMRVYLKQDPTIYISFKDIVKGYLYPNGNAYGSAILGRGSFTMNHLTQLDPETGKGKPGPSWTVGAQGVEIEYDTTDCTYRLVKAVTVIDVGKVINPKTAKGLVMGGMSMGLGLGTREEFLYGNDGVMLSTSFRTYKTMRYGENPEYIVDFVETPQIDAPYGARGIAEHGIIGISGALGNAISLAAGIDVDYMPITPEYIWKKTQEVCK